MAFFVKSVNPLFHTDSHPCVRIGGPVDCIGEGAGGQGAGGPSLPLELPKLTPKTPQWQNVLMSRGVGS